MWGVVEVSRFYIVYVYASIRLLLVYVKTALPEFPQPVHPVILA